MSETLDIELEPDPLLVVLGVSDHLFQPNKHHQQLLSYALIVAKKLILMFWKKTEVPTAKSWLDELVKVSHLERIRFSLTNRLKHFRSGNLSSFISLLRTQSSHLCCSVSGVSPGFGGGAFKVAADNFCKRASKLTLAVP